MTRKPIQIAFDHDSNMHVLADDGTMWWQASNGWRQIDELPQPEPEVIEPAPESPPLAPITDSDIPF